MGDVLKLLRCNANVGLAFPPKIARKCFLPEVRPGGGRGGILAIGEDDHGGDYWCYLSLHLLTRPEQLEVPGSCWNQAENPKRTGAVSSLG